MSRFDDIVANKFSKITEAGTMQTPAQQAPQQGQGAVTAQPAQAAAAQPVTAAQPQTQQQSAGPEQALTNAFRAMKFGDGQAAVNVLNTAFKNAGPVPGIKEFFSTVAFDPNKGFIYMQQQPQGSVT